MKVRHWRFCVRVVRPQENFALEVGIEGQNHMLTRSTRMCYGIAVESLGSIKADGIDVVAS